MDRETSVRCARIGVRCLVSGTACLEGTDETGQKATDISAQIEPTLRDSVADVVPSQRDRDLGLQLHKGASGNRKMMEVLAEMPAPMTFRYVAWD